MIPPKPSSEPLTPAQKSAITKAKNKSNKAARAAEVSNFWELYDAEENARDDDIRKGNAAETARKIARIKNPPPRNAPLVTPPRIVSKNKLTDAKIKRAEEAALRKTPPPDPNAPKPTKPRKQLQLEYPSPAGRPAPNYALPRTKNDITGKRNNALSAAGKANRANPGESRHHQYLLEHEGVRVKQGRFTAPVVPPSSRTTDQPTIRANWERVAPKQPSRPAPKPKPMKPYTPTSVLTGIPKPMPKPAWGYALGRPMGQLALFPNADIPKPGEVPWTPPPKPNPRKDPPLQYTPPKPPPNTGKGRLAPTPHKPNYEFSSNSKKGINTPTSKRTRPTRPGGSGFGGGALGVLAGPLIYGAAFGIKERSFSGFLKGLDIYAGGGTSSRGSEF